MVHVYNPRGIRRAIDAGAKSIEHGQLVDEPTARYMSEQGVWWSLQPLLDDEAANPKTGAARDRQRQTQAGTDNAYNLAKKYRIKIAWGTDTLFAPGAIPRMNFKVTKLTRWYAPGEVLRMVTGQNSELPAMSGARSPYGQVGIIEEGAMTDLILVDGDTVADIRLIEDPDRYFLVIMKDGRLYKDAAN
jgi:imidazolonepropionase-like amidohydrolase